MNRINYGINHRVESINGTAKEGEDFVKVKEIVEFNENEEEKDVYTIYSNGVIYIFNFYIFVYTLDSRRNTR